MKNDYLDTATMKAEREAKIMTKNYVVLVPTAHSNLLSGYIFFDSSPNVFFIQYNFNAKNKF